MGEAYKGLTIRIGADTTPLQVALKNTNSALNATQSLLRTITKGLKFEPGNVKLLQAQMRLLNENIQNTAVKASDLRTAYRETVDNASTGLQKWIDYEGNLSNALARNQDALRTVEFRIAALKEELRPLAEQYNVTFNQKHFDKTINGLLRVNNLSEAEKKKVREVSDGIKQLDASWEHLDATVKDIGTAAELRKMKIQAEALDVETKRLIADYVKLETSMDFERATSGVRKSKEYTAMLSAAMQKLEAETKQVDKALANSPHNVEAFVAKLKLAEDRAEMLNEELNSVRNTLKEYAAAGIERSNESMLQLVNSTEKARIESERLDNILAQWRAKITITERHMEALNQEIREGTGDVGQMKAEYQKLHGELVILKRNEERATEEAKEAKRALMTKEAQADVRALEAREKELTAAVKAQNSALSKNRRKWESLRDLSTTLAATITPLVTMGAYKVIQAADDIDSAYRDMRKTVNGTEEDFEKLRDTAIEYSQTHAVSADTILEIEAMGGQLGITVDKLQEFGEVASNLDIATDMDSDTIAEQLGQLNNILDWGEGDMERYSNALVRLGNNMPAQESHISQIATRISSMGQIVGMTTDEVLAWSTAAAATGQGAEAAGTALSRTMSQIETAVANGGDKLDQFAAVAGADAETFAKTWGDSPSSALQQFILGLKRIDDEGGSVDKTLGDLGINAVRQKQLLQSLTTTTDVLSDALIMSKDAWNGIDDQWGAAGDAAREAAQKSEGFSGALQILKNNANDLGYAVGEAILPALKILTEVVKGVTEAFNNMSPVAKTTTVALVGFLGILGPGMRIVSQFAATMGSLGTASGGAGTGVKTLYERLGNGSPRMQALQMRLLDVATATDTSAKSFKGMQAKMASTILTSKGLAIALSALKTVGIMAAVTAVIMLIGKLSELAKENNLVKESFEAFETTSGDAFSDAASSARTLRDTVVDVRSAVVESAQSIADMKKSWKEQETELYGSQKAMEHYLEVIDNATAPTEEVQQALDYVNQATGQSVQLFDEAGNKINGATEELHNNAQAWIDNAKAQAYAAMLKDAWTAYYDIQMKLVDAAKEREQAEADLQYWEEQRNAGVLGAQDMVDSFSDKVEKLKENERDLAQQEAAATQSIENLGEAADGAANSAVTMRENMENVIKNAPGMESALQSADSSVQAFATELDQAGYSLSDLQSLSDESWKAIADAVADGESGVSVAASLIDGDMENMKKSMDTVPPKAQSVASQIASAFSFPYADSWGVELGRKVADGLSSVQKYASDASLAYAQSLASGIHFSLPDIGPLRKLPTWPIHMAQQWAIGTKKALPIYTKSSLMAASAIASDMPTQAQLGAYSTAAHSGSSYLASSTVQNTYIVNGLTYDDGTNVANAVSDLMRAARIQRRA